MCVCMYMCVQRLFLTILATTTTSNKKKKPTTTNL